MSYNDYVEEQARIQRSEEQWTRMWRFNPPLKPKAETAEEMGVPEGWVPDEEADDE